jgi:predicted metal-dependent HD superfamily phosphohydrolase
MDLNQRWRDLWVQAGLPIPHRLGADLIRAWQEPHRHYHTPEHLIECLRLLDEHGADFEVEQSLWFHDAFQDPRRSDNEEASAQWAERELPACGVAPEAVVRIGAMIRATAGHAVAADAQQALLLDLDLAILGATPKRFAAYERQIRAEYAWVPEPLYRTDRRKILQKFATMVPLFRTEAFQTRFTAAAHRNLTQAIATLT